MANITVSVEYPIKDGTGFTIHAPCDCSQVDGVTVKHPGGTQSFAFKDAHGNDLTGLGDLFAEGSLVKIILDTTNSAALIQNADTNAYLEKKFGGVVESWDDAVSNGWYTANDNDAPERGPYESWGYVVRSEDHNGDLFIAQNVYYSTALVDTHVYFARRYYICGAWQEWEYSTPDMYPDVEYKTPERYMGSPVYVKRINIDALPTANNNVSVPISSHDITVVGFEAYANGSATVDRFPVFAGSGSVMAIAWIDGKNVCVKTYQDMSAYSGVFYVKYIK